MTKSESLKRPWWRGGGLLELTFSMLDDVLPDDQRQRLWNDLLDVADDWPGLEIEVVVRRPKP